MDSAMLRFEWATPCNVRVREYAKTRPSSERARETSKEASITVWSLGRWSSRRHLSKHRRRLAKAQKPRTPHVVHEMGHRATRERRSHKVVQRDMVAPPQGYPCNPLKVRMVGSVKLPNRGYG